MEYRIHVPVLFQTLHGQPLKQIFFPLKVSLKSGHQQAFPKPPRTAQKIHTVRVSQSVNQFGLVYIYTIPVTQLLKILYTYGVSSVIFFHILIVF